MALTLMSLRIGSRTGSGASGTTGRAWISGRKSWPTRTTARAEYAPGSRRKRAYPAMTQRASRGERNRVIGPGLVPAGPSATDTLLSANAVKIDPPARHLYIHSLPEHRRPLAPRAAISSPRG